MATFGQLSTDSSRLSYYHWGRRSQREEPLCFRYMMAYLIVEVPKLLRRADLEIEMILESGDVGSADAPRIISQVKKDLPDDTRMLGKVVFGDKKKFPGLQAADCLAYGALNMEREAILSFGEFTSGSLEDAKRAAPNVRPPVMRLHLDAAALGSLKTDILALVDYRKRYAAARVAEKGDDPS